MNNFNSLLPAFVVVPIVVRAALLLAECNPRHAPFRAALPAAGEFAARVNQITVLLEGMLANSGWSHAGLKN